METIMYTVDFNSQKAISKNTIINPNKLSSNRVQLSSELIMADDNIRDSTIAPEHKSEPIKSIEDINKLSEYFISNRKFRDNMLFVVGINFGLRVSDLCRLRFCDLIDENLTFKRTFPILERKTRNTRSHRRNRYVTINQAVIDAVTLYLQHNPSKLSDYMFKSESNRTSKENIPMTRMSVDRILKDAAKACNISCKMSTHSLRKTFGYHQMMMSNNDPRKLLLLQKIFGHSTMLQTLDYIGLTNEEMEEAYLNLNLGSSHPYLLDSSIGENDSVG